MTTKGIIQSVGPLQYDYRTFSNISRLDYKPNIRLSFENLSKIENSYISRVEKKRNLAKYVKKKRNFAE